MVSEPDKNQEFNGCNSDGMDEVDTLNAQAWELACKQDIGSFALAERALYLSRYQDDSVTTYLRGAALALRTLSNIETTRCNFPIALKHLFEALDLLESLDEPEALLTVIADLGWVYFNLGDFSRAVQIILNGLKIAREKNCLDSEVNLLCSLGGIYCECGNSESSIEILQRALDYKKDAGLHHLQITAYNNLGMTYLSMQEYDQAMDCVSRALDIARQLGPDTMIANFLDTGGRIALARKEYDLAEYYIMESIALNRSRGVEDEEVCLSLGRLYYEQGRLEDAIHLLLDALESVNKKGAHRFGYLFHELLSKMYEAQNDYGAALVQYKLFEETMSQILSEDNQHRLDNLAVLHQLETNRMDSEIFRLKNRALEREISTRRKDVAHMEVLATTDALTGLLNRRHFLTLGGYAVEQAQKTGKPLIVLWMDIDNFKQVNDHYGHLVGDEVLINVSNLIQSNLRSGDLLSRFGGEEFVALLLDTPLTAAQQVAERIVKNTAACVTQVKDQNILVTLSMGAAHTQTATEGLEALLNRADQAQYKAKRAGKNRVVLDW